jgi:hypothetical protein
MMSIFYSAFIRGLVSLSFCFSFWLTPGARAADFAYGAAFDLGCPEHILDSRRQSNLQQAQSVVMIDEASSGALLPEAFRSLGLQVVRVQSTVTPPKWYGQLAPPHYLYDGNLDHLAESLRPLGIRAVAHGTDLSSGLSNLLSHKLGAPNVAMQFSSILRDKYEQNRYLASLGLPVPDTFATDDLDRMLEWLNKHGKFPVVVKPLDSSGSDGIHICSTEAQVREAFSALYGKPNVDGNINSRLIIQEFLQGRELVVNFASSGGVHLLTDVWEYHKQVVHKTGGSTAHIRSHNELLPLSQVDPAVIQYCLNILQAFEYWYGASHFEVMLTEAGPRLVELNPRLAGAQLPRLVHEAGGWHPALLTAEALARPELFKKRLESKTRPEYQPGRMVRLISKQHGTIVEVKHLDKIQALASYKSHRIREAGWEIRPTVDLGSCPGTIFLSHSDTSQLERDMHTIRELEAIGLFLIQ